MLSTVAIIGAAGFIGRNLYEAMAHLNPLTVDRNARPHVQLVQDLEHAYVDLSGIETVISCASHPHVWGEPVDIFHESKIVQRLLFSLNRSPSVKTLIYLSSSSVYGDDYATPTEMEPIQPKSRYGTQKAIAEAQLLKWAMQGSRLDVNVYIIRVFNAIGRHQRKTMLPYVLVQNALLGATTNIYSSVYRSWTPVSNLCEAIKYLARERPEIAGGLPCRILNYGNEIGRTQAQVIDMLDDILWRYDLPKVKTSFKNYQRTGESGSYAANMILTRKAFPQLPLPDYDLRPSLKDVVHTVIEDLTTEHETKNLVALHDPLRAY